MFKPTPEQDTICSAYDQTKSNLMIVAYAGCAKTTTLELLAKRVDPKIPTSMLAFNVSIKKELEKRVPETIKVMTVNGLGHRAWAGAISSGIRLEDRKIGTLVSQLLTEEGNNSSDDWNAIRILVDSAMTSGLTPKDWPNARGLLPDTDEAWVALSEDIVVTEYHIASARKVLDRSIRLSYEGTICFNDQIYMSACFGGAFPGFQLVMVDESQDLSPLNHVMLRKTARGRLIVVGDPKQAIYAFRGADSTSMEKIRLLRDDWIDLPLATTFRCPKAAVRRALSHAPGFKAFDTNAEGTITRLPVHDAESPKVTWSWNEIETLAKSGRGGPRVAILCRNNAPLFAMAFKLIKQKRACVMLGRDIGKGLIALVKKILPLPNIGRVECMRLIKQWEQDQCDLATVNKQEAKINSIHDKAECLYAILENGEIANAAQLQNAIADLFETAYATITLATGHKAKGLEWDTVVHLDPWRCKARGEKESQEANIQYVIETRVKEHLVLASLEHFEE